MFHNLIKIFKSKKISKTPICTKNCLSNLKKKIQKRTTLPPQIKNAQIFLLPASLDKILVYT